MIRCEPNLPKNRRVRILCADDDTFFGEVVVCLFAREGFWVEHVEDGAKAWRRLSPNIHGFDVIVTDHQMPRMSGLGLVKRLRAAGFCGPIIVHSSGITTEEAARYRGLGVRKIVAKPARADELLRAIAA
jgi:CheY-like chemotaxis protein